MHDVIQITKIIFNSFMDIWPYLLLTIPLSVAVHVSGAARFINKVIRKKPLISIFLATIVGAFSPFCSCTIIPIIASMLIGGVPLAPVMSFWIASPSMDPEIFLLSVSMLGWNLAIWRLVTTLVLSLSAGYITHLLVKTNWFGDYLLSSSRPPKVKKMKELMLDLYMKIKEWYVAILNSGSQKEKLKYVYSSNDNPIIFDVKINAALSLCRSDACENTIYNIEKENSCECANTREPSKPDGDKRNTTSLSSQIVKETWSATSLVVKFMVIAFLVKALISLYVPDELVLSILGKNNLFSVLIATIIGVPFYTSNLTALPLVSGFLEQGMDSGAALAFLIAGPITTLPAMAAVWGIANRRVFAIYLLVPLLGAIVFGYLFNLIKII